MGLLTAPQQDERGEHEATVQQPLVIGLQSNQNLLNVSRAWLKNILNHTTHVQKRTQKADWFILIEQEVYGVQSNKIELPLTHWKSKWNNLQCQIGITEIYMSKQFWSNILPDPGCGCDRGWGVLRLGDMMWRSTPCWSDTAGMEPLFGAWSLASKEINCVFKSKPRCQHDLAIALGKGEGKVMLFDNIQARSKGCATQRGNQAILTATASRNALCQWFKTKQRCCFSTTVNIKNYLFREID